MKLRTLLPYILVFFISFFATPFIIMNFAKIANNRAHEYVEGFKPVTSELRDGIYEGKYKAFGIVTMSKVEFVIKNGLVNEIEFKRMFHSPGSIYKENIVNQIKQTHKLEVNAISGATRTSNFAKAAIKNAINNNHR